MKHRLAATLILSLILLIILVIPHAEATTLAQDGRPPDFGQVSSNPCPIEVPDSVRVECGALQVPENYADPESPNLKLPYIILHSRNPNHAPDPLIFTAGGPGWSSLDSAWSFVNSPMLKDRDVIVFEQRGNKYAQPNLVCERSIWWEEAPGQTPCLDSVRDKGIDITQYNTQKIVQDIIILRQALGYEQWNLYGTSFSTSLMLLVMESDPDGVRSAILHSVKPPNETTFAHEADSALRAIQQMLTDCAADRDCAAAYPDLETDFYEMVKDLNSSPIEIKVKSSIDGELIPVQFDGDKFIDWIMLDSFYQPAFPPFGTANLPLLISEVSGGNTQPLKSAAQKYWSNMIDNAHWSWGLMLAINCQQEMPAAGSNRPATDIAASDKLDGFSRSAAQRAICTEWDLAAIPPAATEYVQSDIPALVLAGSYDPVSPPEWSRATADHLPSSTYVEFAGYGHDVTLNNPCAQHLQTTFLKDPLGQLDISCVAEAAVPSFILPENVYIAPGLAASGYDISIGDPRGIAWIETVSIIGMLGLILSLVGLLVLGLAWLAKRRKREASLDKTAAVAYMLALVMIIALLTIPVLTTQINAEYLGRNEMLYSLGPSRDFGPAVLLAWISPLVGLMILTLAVMTLRAWLARRWTRSIRVLTSLVVLASMPMIMLGLRWGLFTMLV